MSKRLGVRVALAIATLGAMTLLQGCADEDDMVFRFAWAPVGSVSIPWFDMGFSQGAAAATSPTTSGAVATAGTP